MLVEMNNEQTTDVPHRTAGRLQCVMLFIVTTYCARTEWCMVREYRFLRKRHAKMTYGVYMGHVVGYTRRPFEDGFIAYSFISTQYNYMCMT